MSSRAVFLACLFLLVVYYSPMFFLDYKFLTTRYFRDEDSQLPAIAKTLGAKDPAFADIGRVVAGLFSGSALGFLSKKGRKARKQRAQKPPDPGAVQAKDHSEDLAWTLVVIVAMACLFSLLTYYAFQLNGHYITEFVQDNSVELLSGWAADRFRETLMLLFVMLGVKGQDAFAAE